MATQQQVEFAIDWLDKNSWIRLGSRGQDYQQICCPFHNGGKEKRPSSGILLHDQVRNGKNTHAGFFHCFSCGAARDFSSFLKDLCEARSTTSTGSQQLDDLMHEKPSQDSMDMLINPDTMSEVLDKYAVESLRLRVQNKHEFVSEEELAKYRFTVPYMYERHLTDYVIEKYDVGFDGNYVPFGKKKAVPCITVPINDQYGNTLFVWRRAIDYKMFFMPEQVEKPVFGLDKIDKNCKSLIITESIFNCLSAAGWGYQAVALLGTGTPKQYDILRKTGIKEFVICLDPDSAGLRGAKKLREALSGSAFVWTCNMPEGKDVNDLDKWEFDEIYANRE